MDKNFNRIKKVETEESAYSIEKGANRLFKSEQREAIDKSSHTPSLDEQDGNRGDDEPLD